MKINDKKIWDIVIIILNLLFMKIDWIPILINKIKDSNVYGKISRIFTIVNIK